MGREDVVIPPDQLLVLMTVDIGASSADEIRIHEGDDPEDLAREFVARNGLDPDNVIGEGPYGPVTLLPTLIDHVRENKETAHQRMVKAMQEGTAPADVATAGGAPAAPADAGDVYDDVDGDRGSAVASDFGEDEDIDFSSDGLPIDDDDDGPAKGSRSGSAGVRRPGSNSRGRPAQAAAAPVAAPAGGLADTSFDFGALDSDDSDDDAVHASAPAPAPAPASASASASAPAPSAIPASAAAPAAEPRRMTAAELDDDMFAYLHDGDQGAGSHDSENGADDDGEFDPDARGDGGGAHHDDVNDGYGASAMLHDDHDEDLRPASPTSTVSSRYMMGTADDKEREYEALRRSFVSGMGARGGRARGQRPRAKPRAKTRVPRRSRVNVPRVANIRHRTSTPTLYEEPEPERKLRSPTADEAPVFNRLYHEARQRDERRMELILEQQKKDEEKFAQFKAKNMGGEGYLARTPSSPSGAHEAKGVRLYKAGLAAMQKQKQHAEVLRKRLEETKDWICPICAHQNLGTSKTCTNVVKSGKVVMVRRAGPNSALRPAEDLTKAAHSPGRSVASYDDADSTQMLDEFGNVSARRHAPPRVLSDSGPPEWDRDATGEFGGPAAAGGGGVSASAAAAAAAAAGAGPEYVRLCGTAKPKPFTPTISTLTLTSQSRYHQPRESWAKQKEAMVQEAREKELQECTFKPAISAGSAAIISNSRAAHHTADGEPTTAGANPFTRLYSAALKSQAAHRDRVINANAHEDITFTPTVNRRKSKNTIYGGPPVHERLYLEREHKAKRLGQLAAAASERDPTTGEELFKPKVGRAPRKARNKMGLEIWEYLYTSRHQKEDLLQELSAQEQARLAAAHSARYTTSKSDHLVESLRARAFGRIFRRLQRSATLSVEEKQVIARRQLRLTGRRPKAPIGPPSPGRSRLRSAHSDDGRSMRSFRSDRDDADHRPGDMSLESLAQRPVYGAGFGTSGAGAGASGAAGGVDSDNDSVFESDESTEEDPRPEPTGTVCGTEVWTGVLHPDVEAVVLPVFAATEERAVDFGEFSELLGRSVESSGPGPRIYLLTKPSHLDRLRKHVAKQETAECTHKPKLAPASRRIYDNLVADGTGRGLPAHERLHARSRLYEDNKRALKEKFVREELSECTFKPHLNSTRVDSSRVYDLDASMFPAEDEKPPAAGGASGTSGKSRRKGASKGSKASKRSPVRAKGRKAGAGAGAGVGRAGSQSPAITSPPLAAASALPRGSTSSVSPSGEVAAAMSLLPSRFSESPAFAGVSASATSPAHGSPDHVDHSPVKTAASPPEAHAAAASPAGPASASATAAATLAAAAAAGVALREQQAAAAAVPTLAPAPAPVQLPVSAPAPAPVAAEPLHAHSHLPVSVAAASTAFAAPVQNAQPPAPPASALAAPPVVPAPVPAPAPAPRKSNAKKKASIEDRIRRVLKK